jgi:hypothetical protein
MDWRIWALTEWAAAASAAVVRLGVSLRRGVTSSPRPPGSWRPFDTEDLEV